MEPLALPLPTFLIIGAQKSATRWLRLNLGLHPDVFAASAELEFFNNGVRFRDEGTDWYRGKFSGWNGEAIVGEATPGYMFWRHGPAVVAWVLNNVADPGNLTIFGCAVLAAGLWPFLQKHLPR